MSKFWQNTHKALATEAHRPKAQVPSWPPIRLIRQSPGETRQSRSMVLARSTLAGISPAR